MKLTGAVYAKDQELGTASPLRLIETPSWDELGPVVDEALKAQAEIEKRERRLKELYSMRDPYLNASTENDRRSRDLLLGI